MFKLFNIVTGTITLLSLAACSSTPRTKWTDKTMTIIVSPEGISSAHYVKIQSALVKSGRWVVLDRAMGLEATIKEQDMLHVNASNRFEDRQKLAMWGKLHGAGGVVISHAVCQRKYAFITGSRYNHCDQYVAIIDTNTSKVLAVAEGSENTDANEYELAPSWDSVVAELESNYPEYFEKNKDTEILENYRDVAGEEALRIKEGNKK